MLSRLRLPKPRSEEDFEDLVAQLFSRQYSNHNLQRYARKGQSQHGVDIAGVNKDNVVGIQCKNHALANVIKESEIEAEISKADGFSPELSEYIITTSADRDGPISSKVMKISKDRSSSGKFPVRILFWEDICQMFEKYPDLARQLVLKDYSGGEFDLIRPGDKLPHTTLHWPSTAKDIQDQCEANLNGLKRVDDYQISVGLTSFSDFGFDKDVDLSVFLDQESNPSQILSQLNDLHKVISQPTFSRDIDLHLRTRLPHAFLAGWVFRKVKGYSFTIQSSGQYWDTEFPLDGTSELFEGVPYISANPKATELAVILNISQSIEDQVIPFVSGNPDIRSTISYHLNGYAVKNAAHASLLSREIAFKLKNMSGLSSVTKIHLFGAFPAALGFMIGHRLNAIKPITHYYLGDDRKTFKMGAEITNNS